MHLLEPVLPAAGLIYSSGPLEEKGSKKRMASLKAKRAELDSVAKKYEHKVQCVCCKEFFPASQMKAESTSGSAKPKKVVEYCECEEEHVTDEKLEKMMAAMYPRKKQ